MTHVTPDIDAHLAPFAGACLRDLRRRSALLRGLDPELLLHAGPPYATDADIPLPVRQAAAQALIYEGQAADVAQGLALLATGRYRLAPAQDYGVVTPLAQVVSASMPLLVVGDDTHQAYAPVVEGPPPALRFGSAAPSCVEALQRLTVTTLNTLAPALRRAPVPMAPLIARALSAGDDCHSRTVAANAALVEALGDLDPAMRAALAANAGFVLPVLMAASAWSLARGLGSVAAVGGNGHAFGLRLHGMAGWTSVPATPPRGHRLPGAADAALLPAIGDSAVIDFCGLGGQALAWAPALREEWQALLPADWAARAAAVTDPGTGLVSPARVAAEGAVPIVHLAMLDAAGTIGLAGRGFYEPPMAVFAAALAEVPA